MSPILGTLASQFSGKPFTNFESISTVTGGNGGSGIVIVRYLKSAVD